MLTITFVSPDGKKKQECTGEEGQSLLAIAHENDVDLEGACEGSMACSTCHVIVTEPWFLKLPIASEFEEDMLDLTYGLKLTSRLGCQITLTRELDGLEVYLPSQTVNLSS